MNEPNHLAVILLAAGSSSRMGKSKQLLSIQGTPLLRKAALAATESQANKVIVVLGSGDDMHRAVLRFLPVEIVINKDWQKGMGASLRTGLSYAINNNPLLSAVVVMVCDQPLLTTTHLNALIQKFLASGSLIVASAYAGTVGVPAVFGKKMFPKLLALEESQGARKIISDNAHAMVSIPFPGGEVDLDTNLDYAKFLRGD